MVGNKDFSYYSLREALEVLGELGSSKNGLGMAEAGRRLEKYGLNQIRLEEVYWWQIFIRQFKSPFVYLLILASLLSFVLGQKVDALMIFAFIAVNSALGFYQEYRSERTVKLLKKYIASRAKLLRDGCKVFIDIKEIVPGDVIFLEPGDIIPADVRFFEANSMEIDESVLTGESAPVYKHTDFLIDKKVSVHKAKNIGFGGTTVVSGSGKAVVFATGKYSNYAKIVALTNTVSRQSTFEKELTNFSKFTLGIVSVVLLLVIATSISVKPNPSLVELILFSIALAVSVVPEALPVVTTFSLSIGALKLAKSNVIVKRLSAIEDLGGLQVLASDKTGTLTENKMEVDEIFSENKEETLVCAYLSSCLFNNEGGDRGDAFDVAIAKRVPEKLKKNFFVYESLAKIPFDPVRKRASSLISDGRKRLLVTRGASEEILKICNLSSEHKKQILEFIVGKGREGKRVLCVARKIIEGFGVEIKSQEHDMEFLGAVSFTDPIKISSYKAIERAKKLGVAVKILTGDSCEVAADVALKIGLVKSKGEVISGDEFGEMALQDKYGAVEKYKVFARVTPQQKYEIIKLLEEKFSVGFLGDGINDAPALKIANVALVVQGATDVAREAADVVLLKKDLNVILEGVESGRKVFENTSKYITATMTSNFGNFFAIAFVSIFIDFLPMLPLQILLLNLLSDFPMIFIATDNVDDEAVSAPRSYDLKSFARVAIFLGIISTLFDFIYFTKFLPEGQRVLQTSWFMGSVLTEIMLIFSIRTRKFMLKSNRPSLILVILTVTALVLTILIPYTLFGQRLFSFAAPSVKNITLVVSIAFTYLVLTEAVKNLCYKRLLKQK